MTVRLSPRQQQLLQQIAVGATTKQIAETLHYSRDTVREYRTVLYRKLGARNAAHAVAIGYQKGLLS